MAMYKDIALAVEGGGMRGAYSAGVLDVFLDNGLKFGACAGTSAGATHLCSYLSEQRERNKRLDIIHSASKRYMSWGNLIRTGDFFALDYCYNQIPRVVDPFDFEKFRENAVETKFYAVATNLETGGPEYLLTRDLDKPEGFVKKPNSMIPLFKIIYRKYPKFIEAARTRHIRYNQCRRTLEERVAQGSAFMIRPSAQFKISCFEKDKSKLVDLYDMGVKDATTLMPKLLEFLEK